MNLPVEISTLQYPDQWIGEPTSLPLFGPRSLFVGRAFTNAHALWAPTACSPCVNAYHNWQSVCRNNLCMQAITGGQVLERVRLIHESRRDLC
jgi:hypothetical protein